MTKATKWLIVIGVLLHMSLPVQARELIIVGVPAPPMRYFDEQKNLKGFDIEVIDFILTRRLGLKYTVKLIDSSPRIKKECQKGHFDILLSFSHKEERSIYLIYPKESHVSVAWHFFILKKNAGKIVFNTYEDLKGWRIGATAGKSYTPAFWEAGKSFLKLDIMATDEPQIRKLLKGRIDAVPLETASALYEARTGRYLNQITYLKKPIKRKPYYNTFVKNSPYPNLDKLMKMYDRELKEMKGNGTLAALQRKYGLEVSD
ncbi:substrate-binding periplasmic protein [candidate division CSSED10-310 bacterium]|uniref:Substrate-binding periplasmic protein n=1 Tax=candidate division CSSED10-310 bacterium TaxID=2855610 RepID=A0ABV6YZN8_UNCC1